jgi:hypothetical protein
MIMRKKLYSLLITVVVAISMAMTSFAAVNYPVIDGMTTEQPAVWESGKTWTVNVNTGKYHGVSSVDKLLPENTRYYTGDPSALEAAGYARCKKKGCN